MKRMLLAAVTVAAIAASATAANNYKETFGTVDTASPYPLLTAYTGYDNALPITYGGDFSSVRDTAVSTGYTGASGVDNVWFPQGASPATLIISGINTQAASAHKLSFGLLRSVSTITEFAVAYSTDGTNFTNLTIPALTNTSWNLVTATETLPAVASLTLKFTASQTVASSGFRVDDVIIGDVPDAPPPPTFTPGTVAQAKAAADATGWQITGVVTSIGGSTGRLQFTVQDATGGLVVDKGSATYTQPTVGDNVTVSGIKAVFNGVVQLAPPAAANIVINSNGNALPAPRLYNSITDALAANVTEFAGLYVRINNVYLVSADSVSGGAVIGTTTWLDPASTTGGINYTISDGTASTTLRITSDVGTKLTVWTAKVRPTLASNSDRFDVVGVGGLFSNVPQFYMNDPAGTAAKTDVDGPIRPATAPSAVADWAIYN